MTNELRVYYPHGGHYYILHWWTYNERGHVAIGTSEDNVSSIAARVFERHPDAEIRAYLEIEIVGPSNLLCTLAKEHALKEEIDIFHKDVVYRLHDVIEAGESLPPQFTLCDKYEPEDESGMLSDDEWGKNEHHSCKNCTATIKMVDMTQAQLFQKYNEGWRKLYPVLSYNDKRHVISRARCPSDDEKLWFANAAFGHHSSGISLEPVDLEQAKSYRPAYLSDTVLFFYRKIRELDPAKLQAMLDQQKNLVKEKQEQREKERVTRHQMDSKAKIEATISFFTNKDNEDKLPPLDLHLGGAQEEERGLKWLQEREEREITSTAFGRIIHGVFLIGALIFLAIVIPMLAYYFNR